MSPAAPGFGALTPRQIRGLLERHLGYVAVRQAGSHLHLRSPDHNPVVLAIHGKEFGPQLVRDILVKQVGLTLDEAKEVMRRG